MRTHLRWGEISAGWDEFIRILTICFYKVKFTVLLGSHSGEIFHSSGMSTSYKQLLSRLQRLDLVENSMELFWKSIIKKFLSNRHESVSRIRGHSCLPSYLESFFITLFTFYTFLPFLEYNFQVSGKRETTQFSKYPAVCNSLLTFLLLTLNK